MGPRICGCYKEEDLTPLCLIWIEGPQYNSRNLLSFYCLSNSTEHSSLEFSFGPLLIITVHRYRRSIFHFSHHKRIRKQVTQWKLESTGHRSSFPLGIIAHEILGRCCCLGLEKVKLLSVYLEQRLTAQVFYLANFWTDGYDWAINPYESPFVVCILDDKWTWTS